MLQDFTFQQATNNWFYKFLESVRSFLVKVKSMKDENYFLIN
jgi:hypothetical protein